MDLRSIVLDSRFEMIDLDSRKNHKTKSTHKTLRNNRMHHIKNLTEMKCKANIACCFRLSLKRQNFPFSKQDAIVSARCLLLTGSYKHFILHFFRSPASLALACRLEIYLSIFMRKHRYRTLVYMQNVDPKLCCLV